MSLLEDSPETPPSVYQAAKISNCKKYCSNNKRRHLSIKTSGTRKNNGASFFSTLFRNQNQQRDQQRQQEHQKQQSVLQPNLDPTATDFITKVNSSASSTITSVDSSSTTVNDINYFFDNNNATLDSDKEDEPSPTGFTPITPTIVLPAPPLHTASNENVDTNAINKSGRKLTKSGSDAAEALRPALSIFGTQEYLQQRAETAAKAIDDYNDDDNDYSVVEERSVESCWSCSSDSSSVLFLGEEDVSLLPGYGSLSRYTNISSSSSFFPPSPAPTRAQARIIQIPEIVSLIVEHVDAFTPAPQEQRRNHDRKQDSPHQPQQPQSASEKDAGRWSHGGTMFSCLLINKLWYTETRRILYKNIHFRDDESTIDAFLHSNELPNTYDNNNKYNKTLIKPKSLVLHKTSSLSQAKADRLATAVAGGLEWLELYTCPQLAPSLAFATGGQLRTLILPGCAALTDSTLGHLARASPLLETLDLRACEQISDKSIRVVAHYCPQLAMLNVGRTRQGHRITNKGIRSIARHTQIRVLGVAGCHITDTAVWELALRRGPHLERVSLNNCILLTNASVPKVLGYIARSLSVLEIKNLPLVTDLLPFVMFKRYRQYQFGFTPLIEGCKRFDERLREAEYLFEMEVSKQIFSDTLEWIYAPDDDIEYISID